MPLKSLIEDEKLIILHSGEIPEIAYHGSLYHLTEDPEGPLLKQQNIDLTPLKEAVILRYQTIIFRDINHKNREKSVYRGLARAIVNYDRLNKFAIKEGIDIQHIQQAIKKKVMEFLQQEIDELTKRNRKTCINCSLHEIKEFLHKLQIEDKKLLNGIASIVTSK